jgi:CRP/FNR family transcriptional regulator, cyclic AMP receptor protein
MNAQDSQIKSRAVDRKEILRQHPLFSGLPAEIVDKVSAYAIVKDVASGTAIFAKGAPGQSMFAVLSGTVKISAPSFDGKDAVFNFINEGGLFGEIALLDGNTRTADAIAATDCKLLRIDRRDFLPLLRDYPELATKVIDVLCTRLRHTSQQVENIAFLGLPGRLANALLRLAGEREAGGADPAIRITQREIGQVIGMSRESTNKQLRDWQRRKWIRLERGGLVILQHGALKGIANTDIDSDERRNKAPG